MLRCWAGVAGCAAWHSGAPRMSKKPLPICFHTPASHLVSRAVASPGYFRSKPRHFFACTYGGFVTSTSIGVPSSGSGEAEAGTDLLTTTYICSVKSATRMIQPTTGHAAIELYPHSLSTAVFRALSGPRCPQWSITTPRMEAKRMYYKSKPDIEGHMFFMILFGSGCHALDAPPTAVRSGRGAISSKSPPILVMEVDGSASVYRIAPKPAGSEKQP